MASRSAHRSKWSASRCLPGNSGCGGSTVYAIVAAGLDDIAFAHDLSRDNMSGFHAEIGVAWNPALVAASWPSTENYLLLADGLRVGILRLRPAPGALYVSDLQVLPDHRNRGAGMFALGFAERLALGRGLARLQLRAFASSRATALYRRLGFVQVADEGAKLLFEKALT